MKHSNGFSLIELMIVVAIVGILAAFAFNMYADNVIESNRSEGRAGLTATAASLEKCKSLYGVYNHVNCPVLATIPTESNLYSIDTTGRTPTTFTLVAIPVGSQLRDTDCTSFSLTNTGIKTATGGDPPSCW